MEYDVKHYAYIGDAVYELYIRGLVIKKTKAQRKMHELSTRNVCAQKQADIINFLLPYLKEDELDIQHRGRNLKISINKRNNPQIHALATSFEALIGYLYLSDKKRLCEIFELIKPSLIDIN